MVWSTVYRANGSDIVKHTFDWISDASGNATLPSGSPVSGKIERIVIVPSASAAPTAAYDLTLTDPESVDVMAGLGANLSATVTSDATSSVPFVVDGILTLNVSNAGNAKAGKVVVYVR